ncbi:MAG: hypothetical protein ACT4OY_07660 [Alphaproteobacteria bacterium]
MEDYSERLLNKNELILRPRLALGGFSAAEAEYLLFEIESQRDEFKKTPEFVERIKQGRINAIENGFDALAWQYTRYLSLFDEEFEKIVRDEEWQEHDEFKPDIPGLVL